MKNSIILDTDIGGDIDDLGALAVLHALADRGDCLIGGIVSDTLQAHAVSACHAVNRWYERPDIPVAAPENLRETRSYSNAVAAIYPDLPDPNTGPKLPGAFRQMLADANDKSVVIVTIGHFEHVYNLLKSEGDDISPLNGTELVRQKVLRIVSMGGLYPDGIVNRGTDPNFEAGNPKGCSSYAIKHCPVPMAFVGNEVGGMSYGYATGSRLNELPESNPVRIGYKYFFNNPPQWVINGRWETPFPPDIIQPWSIWDQITVYYAVTEDQELFEEIRGTNILDETCHNVFHPSEDGPHCYLVPRIAAGQIANEVIEPLMMTRP